MASNSHYAELPSPGGRCRIRLAEWSGHLENFPTGLTLPAACRRPGAGFGRELRRLIRAGVGARPRASDGRRASRTHPPQRASLRAGSPTCARGSGRDLRRAADGGARPLSAKRACAAVVPFVHYGPSGELRRPVPTDAGACDRKRESRPPGVNPPDGRLALACPRRAVRARRARRALLARPLPHLVGSRRGARDLERLEV